MLRIGGSDGADRGAVLRQGEACRGDGWRVVDGGDSEAHRAHVAQEVVHAVAGAVILHGVVEAGRTVVIVRWRKDDVRADNAYRSARRIADAGDGQALGVLGDRSLGVVREQAGETDRP